MIEREDTYLRKSMESLAGAESEYANGRYNNAANRCYYACFQAAMHALDHAGIRYQGSQPTWSHETVQATFVRELITRRKRYPSELRDVLARTYLLRLSADYRQKASQSTSFPSARQRTSQHCKNASARLIRLLPLFRLPCPEQARLKSLPHARWLRNVDKRFGRATQGHGSSP